MNLNEYIAQREATDPEFRAAREASRPQFELARAMIGARIAMGLTQAQLAARLGRKQPVIARLESGAHPPRLDTLMDLADAAGGEFVIGPGRTIAFRAKRARAGARVKRRAPRSNYLPQAAEQVAAVARS